MGREALTPAAGAVALMLGAVALSAAGCAQEDDACAKYCDAQLDANCGDRDETCAADCREAIDHWAQEGKECDAQFDADLACLGDKTYHCENGITLPPPDACKDETQQLNACLGVSDAF